MTTIDEWAARWAAGQTGFHEAAPNELLVRHGAALLAAAGSIALPRRARVLVPLCGKAHDLLWLARHDVDVLGVEGVEQACRAFFEDHGATPSSTFLGAGHVFNAVGADPALAAVSLLCADFFTLGASTAIASPLAPLSARFDAAYDRAALVAIPPARREAYVDVLGALLGPGAPLLLVSFEYDQSRVDGPPWSLSANQLRQLFASSFELSHLETRAVPVRNARLATAGVSAMSESCYLLRRRGPRV